MKNTSNEIHHIPYHLSVSSDGLTFRVMGFGTYGTHVKSMAILAMVFGALFSLVGVTQLFKVDLLFAPIAFIVFGAIDLLVGIRMWLVGAGIEIAQQYRQEHNGEHPKDSVYVYTSSSKTLTKIKNESTEVLSQGTALTYSVRKTSSHGGFAGYLFTLHWPSSSAIVVLGEDETEKQQIEQYFQVAGIQATN